MRRSACLAILLVGLAGCARLQEYFKWPPWSERSAATTPARAPAARPTPPAPPPPPLTPQISLEEERRLSEDTQRKIGETDRLLRQLEGRQMKPEERELFLAAQDFLNQARRALAAREFQRAANLASKARALGDDLTSAKRP